MRTRVAAAAEIWNFVQRGWNDDESDARGREDAGTWEKT